MLIGVAYYPEHWPEERWPEDARLMRETGIDVVRLGEFAWSALEPRRLTYDMDWLDRAIKVFAAEGLRVILCTPTAAPPPWLFVRHPSMVPQGRDGRSWFRGSRRHACLNNRPYRRYARRIVREVARAFASRPEVFAWQIDNELGRHDSGRCFCDDCEQAFREWLKRRYGIVERVNKLWGTAFWSQTLNDWHEVPAPRRTPAGPHPSLALDYSRFMSATFRDFVAEQREIIQQYSSRQVPITTNSLALHLDQIDQFSFVGPQEVASVDVYPADGADVDAVALSLDLTRSLKRRPFWVLEQQAGATMIPARHGQPRPGQLRLWSYQSAARGAELISYFPWRTCPFGQEMHWYGLLDADGAPRRRYDELKATIGELRQNASLWEGKLPAARVALVLDYHCHWALQADSMSASLDYMDQFRVLYSLLRRRGVGVDIVPPQAEPGSYALAVAPMPVIARDQDVRLWRGFVEGGGTLLVTAPAGCRTEHNTWQPGLPPGPLSGLLGVSVPEHDTLGSGQTEGVDLAGGRVPCRALCTAVDLDDAEAVASYGSGLYAGRPALTRKMTGKGRAFFLGTVGGRGLYERVLDLVLDEAGLRPHPWSSETLEVVNLQVAEGDQPLTFVLNHAAEPAELALPGGANVRDLLTGREHAAVVSLDAYGVALLQG
jgi:beta-galactosidase